MKQTKFRRFLALLLCLMMVLPALTAMVVSADPGTITLTVDTDSVAYGGTVELSWNHFGSGQQYVILVKDATTPDVPLYGNSTTTDPYLAGAVWGVSVPKNENTAVFSFAGLPDGEYVFEIYAAKANDYVVGNWTKGVVSVVVTVNAHDYAFTVNTNDIIIGGSVIFDWVGLPGVRYWLYVVDKGDVSKEWWLANKTTPAVAPYTWTPGYKGTFTVELWAEGYPAGEALGVEEITVRDPNFWIVDDYDQDADGYYQIPYGDVISFAWDTLPGATAYNITTGANWLEVPDMGDVDSYDDWKIELPIGKYTFALATAPSSSVYNSLLIEVIPPVGYDPDFTIANNGETYIEVVPGTTVYFAWNKYPGVDKYNLFFTYANGDGWLYPASFAGDTTGYPFKVPGTFIIDLYCDGASVPLDSVTVKVLDPKFWVVGDVYTFEYGETITFKWNLFYGVTAYSITADSGTNWLWSPATEVFEKDFELDLIPGIYTFELWDWTDSSNGVKLTDVTIEVTEGDYDPDFKVNGEESIVVKPGDTVKFTWSNYPGIDVHWLYFETFDEEGNIVLAPWYADSPVGFYSPMLDTPATYKVGLYPSGTNPDTHDALATVTVRVTKPDFWVKGHTPVDGVYEIEYVTEITFEWGVFAGVTEYSITYNGGNPWIWSPATAVFEKDFELDLIPGIYTFELWGWPGGAKVAEVKINVTEGDYSPDFTITYNGEKYIEVRPGTTVDFTWNIYPGVDSYNLYYTYAGGDGWLFPASFAGDTAGYPFKVPGTFIIDLYCHGASDPLDSVTVKVLEPDFWVKDYTPIDGVYEITYETKITFNWDVFDGVAGYNIALDGKAVAGAWLLPGTHPLVFTLKDYVLDLLPGVHTFDLWKRLGGSDRILKTITIKVTADYDANFKVDDATEATVWDGFPVDFTWNEYPGAALYWLRWINSDGTDEGFLTNASVAGDSMKNIVLAHADDTYTIELYYGGQTAGVDIPLGVVTVEVKAQNFWIEGDGVKKLDDGSYKIVYGTDTVTFGWNPFYDVDGYDIYNTNLTYVARDVNAPYDGDVSGLGVGKYTIQLYKANDGIPNHLRELAIEIVLPDDYGYDFRVNGDTTYGAFVGESVEFTWYGVKGETYYLHCISDKYIGSLSGPTYDPYVSEDTHSFGEAGTYIVQLLLPGGFDNPLGEVTITVIDSDFYLDGIDFDEGKYYVVAGTDGTFKWQKFFAATTGQYGVAYGTPPEFIDTVDLDVFEMPFDFGLIPGEYVFKLYGANGVVFAELTAVVEAPNLGIYADTGLTVKAGTVVTFTWDEYPGANGYHVWSSRAGGVSDFLNVGAIDQPFIQPFGTPGTYTIELYVDGQNQATDEPIASLVLEVLEPEFWVKGYTPDDDDVYEIESGKEITFEWDNFGYTTYDISLDGGATFIGGGSGISGRSFPHTFGALGDIEVGLYASGVPGAPIETLKIKVVYPYLEVNPDTDPYVITVGEAVTFKWDAPDAGIYVIMAKDAAGNYIKTAPNQGVFFSGHWGTSVNAVAGTNNPTVSYANIGFGLGQYTFEVRKYTTGVNPAAWTLVAVSKLTVVKEAEIELASKLDAPVLTKVEYSGGTLEVVWTDPNASKDVEYYVVEIAKKGVGTSWEVLHTFTSKSFTWADIDLLAVPVIKKYGTAEYAFRVKAVNSKPAESAFSKTVYCIITVDAAQAPTNLVNNGSGKDIKLAWSGNNIAGAVDFVVQIAVKGDGGSWTTLSDDAKDTVYNLTFADAYTALKLPDNTPIIFAFRVYAKNAFGSSKNSNTVYVDTKLVKAPVLTATLNSSGGVDLVWTDPNATVDNYIVQMAVKGTGKWTTLAKPYYGTSYTVSADTITFAEEYAFRVWAVIGDEQAASPTQYLQIFNKKAKVVDMATDGAVLNGSKFTLTWTDNNNEAYYAGLTTRYTYQIDVAIGGEGKWKVLEKGVAGQLGVNNMVFDLDAVIKALGEPAALGAGKDYAFRVSIVENGVKGPVSKVARWTVK